MLAPRSLAAYSCKFDLLRKSVEQIRKKPSKFSNITRAEVFWLSAPFCIEQEALRGFTTGPLVTSQTRSSPLFSRLHFRLFQVHPKYLGYSTHVTRSVTMRQYFNFSVTLLRYGLKILTDSWIEGDSLSYPDHPPRRCHPECQPTFIHFFTNTLKCLHGRLAG